MPFVARYFDIALNAALRGSDYGDYDRVANKRTIACDIELSKCCSDCRTSVSALSSASEVDQPERSDSRGRLVNYADRIHAPATSHKTNAE